MIDIRQSVQYANYLKHEGWVVERIKGTSYFIKRFPIIGGILKLQRPEKIDFNVIDKLFLIVRKSPPFVTRNLIKDLL